jgi:hypothetical protein
MHPYRTAPRADRHRRARFAALLREAGLHREADRIDPNPYRRLALPVCRCYRGLVAMPTMCGPCRAYRGMAEVAQSLLEVKRGAAR